VKKSMILVGLLFALVVIGAVTATNAPPRAYKEPCVIKSYNYVNSSGPYTYVVWGETWKNPYTNKTICYVPHRGGSKRVPRQNAPSESNVTPPPVPPPVCHTEEVCESHSERVCGIERVCTPKCHDVTHKECKKVGCKMVCKWVTETKCNGQECRWENKCHVETTEQCHNERVCNT